MLKKLVVAGLAVAVGVIALAWFSPRMCSYLHMRLEQASQSLDDAISDPTQEIARLRFEIKNLEKSEPEFKDKVAKEAVEVEKLADKIDADSKWLGGLENNARYFSGKLHDESTRVVSYNGRDWSRDAAEKQLAIDLRVAKSKKAEIASAQNLLAERQKNLAAAKEQLAGLKTARNEMEQEVAELESQLKALQMAQQKTKLAVNDSGYAQVRKDMDRLKDKIREGQKRVELDIETSNGPLHVPNIDRPTTKELLRDADNYFGNGIEKTVADYTK
jgi:DNA repair exonuclease SbcCD ATPase subunit